MFVSSWTHCCVCQIHTKMCQLKENTKCHVFYLLEKQPLGAASGLAGNIVTQCVPLIALPRASIYLSYIEIKLFII